MKNAFDGFISKLDTAKKRNQWAWKYVNRNFPNWRAKRKKEKKQTKLEQNIQEWWDNYKMFKICIMEISEEKQ